MRHGVSIPWAPWIRFDGAERWQAITRAGLLVLALSIAGLIQAISADLPVARQLEAHTRDLIMKTMANETSDPRVAIVDIDEASLKQLGPWPWPRERLAELAERLLSDAGAIAVGFDLVLTDPSITPAGQVGDERLAALASQGWLIAAQAFDYVARDQPVEVGQVGGQMRGGTAPAGAVAASGHVASFAALSAGRCVGNIGFVPDSDGKIRRIAPWTTWAGAHYPAFSMATLACARPDLDPTRLSRHMPLDARGLWAIPFLRQPDSYLAMPALAILAQAPMTERPLAGRIVLVGSSALGLADRVATPLSPSVSGVTVHAAALSALLDATAGQAAPRPPGWVLPVWLIISTVVIWLTIARGSRLRLILGTLMLLLSGWTVVAAWVTLSGAPQAVTASLWGYASALLLHLPLEWSWAQARVRSRTRLLARYVAKDVLDELLSAGQEDPLAPRHADITVLIADMQGYTRLTSRSSLQDAAELTRGFLAQLTRPVLAQRGTLDRYTGDGLVSFWGAPIPVADHADRAVDAAIEILANVKRFNEARLANGDEPVTVRIGIASGSALVGDLGTSFRIAYTAVGDCINLASRLQQLTRELGVGIAVSSSAAQRCERWRFEPLGTVSIRGLPDEPVFTPDSDHSQSGLPPTAPAPGAGG